MRDNEIERRLVAWGRWVVASVQGAAGYPKQTAFARLAANGGAEWQTMVDVALRSFVPVNDVECSAINDAIGTLPRELIMLVRVIYMRDYGMTVAANDLNISTRTLYSRRAQVYQRLREYFDARHNKRQRVAIAEKNILSGKINL